MQAALGSIHDVERSGERLMGRFAIGMVLLGTVMWLCTGALRGGSAPLSRSWVWDAVGPLLAMLWIGALISAVVVPVSIWLRVWRRPSGQSIDEALRRSWKWIDPAPMDRWEAILGGTLVPVLYLALLGLTAGPLWRSSPFGEWNVVVAPLVTFVIFVSLAIVCATAVLMRHRPDPRDRLVEALFETYVAAIGGSDIATVSPPAEAADWRRSRTERVRLARRLEAAAIGVERNLKRVAPIDLADSRKHANDLGGRIAAGFRIHARAVLLGGRERDDALAPALADGLVAASRGRWEELAKAEPASATPRIISSVLERVAIAAVLAGAGLLLAHQFADVQVQEQIRGVFFSAAVLAVVAPRSAVREVADKMRQALIVIGR
ncbi:hypothetical protein DY240_07345 [Jiangella rhizosphaerae]|uniref:Uncharacterized protein n=1 Tax=Jiangella rhizosphaerae TaxID=2293569 RepID=A0A418KTU0_9ACTN|nr:hypothetical protein DY240_07345 [Jiangella rhizosphaerae]